jgi:hypothetical protein
MPLPLLCRCCAAAAAAAAAAATIAKGREGGSSLKK